MKTAAACSLFCLTAVAFAADEQPQSVRGNAEKAFAYTGEDFTRLPTQIGVAYDSGVNHHTGSNTDNYLVTGSLSLLGFQVEAEVPVYARVNPGAGETTDGFGDSLVSGAFALPFNPKLRMAVGCDLLLDTSSRDEIGPDETVYSPFLGIAIEQDEDNLFLGRLAYTDSSDDGFERWELLLRGVHRWNVQLFSSVEATPGWDSRSDDFLLNARALMGARIDRNNVATLEFLLPLDSESREQRGTNLRLNYHFLF